MDTKEKSVSTVDFGWSDTQGDTDVITISSPIVDTLTITDTPTLWDMSTSSADNMIFTNSMSSNPTITIGSMSSPWLINSDDTLSPGELNATNITAEKLTLDGDGADITIRGRSLSDTLAQLDERLNILHVNRELESEWQDLRELGKQYRSLESRILSKIKLLETLKRYDPD